MYISCLLECLTKNTAQKKKCLFSHFTIWGFLVKFHSLWKASFELVFISAAPSSSPPIPGHWAPILAESSITISLTRPAIHAWIDLVISNYTQLLSKLLSKSTKTFSITKDEFTVKPGAEITCAWVETCFACEARSESVVVATETSSSEESDSLYDETPTWDSSPAFCLRVVRHRPEIAFCRRNPPLSYDIPCITDFS